MIVESIELQNYRNYEKLHMDFSDGTNLLYGDNAQGKTNILESIYFLSTLKTPRTSNILELINFEGEYFKLEADIVKANTDIDLYYVYSKEKNVKLRLIK